MKKKIGLALGFLVVCSTFSMRFFGFGNKNCLDRVSINLDYVTNNTNQDYWLALNGQKDLMKLTKNKTQYLDTDIFVKKNVCGSLNTTLGTIYKTQDKKAKVGALELLASNKEKQFTFTAKFNGNEDSVANFSIAKKTFNGQLSLSLDQATTNGSLEKVTISLEEKSIQPDLIVE